MNWTCIRNHWFWSCRAGKSKVAKNVSKVRGPKFPVSSAVSFFELVGRFPGRAFQFGRCRSFLAAGRRCLGPKSVDFIPGVSPRSTGLRGVPSTATPYSKCCAQSGLAQDCSQGSGQELSRGLFPFKHLKAHGEAVVLPVTTGHGKTSGKLTPPQDFPPPRFPFYANPLYFRTRHLKLGET